MTAFIDEHRDAYGVKPICKALPIAPFTYHEHDPGRLSVRARRDQDSSAEVVRVFAQKFGVYSARKV